MGLGQASVVPMGKGFVLLKMILLNWLLLPHSPQRELSSQLRHSSTIVSYGRPKVLSTPGLLGREYTQHDAPQEGERGLNNLYSESWNLNTLNFEFQVIQWGNCLVSFNLMVFVSNFDHITALR